VRNRMSITARYGTTLRCYDNGPDKYADRYTIMPPRWARDYRERRLGEFTALTSSSFPFHPQGIGQHTSAVAGKHLGRRVAWAELPPDVQKFARQSFPEYAPKE
jgi:hypothetical protein